VPGTVDGVSWRYPALPCVDVLWGQICQTPPQFFMAGSSKAELKKENGKRSSSAATLYKKNRHIYLLFTITYFSNKALGIKIHFLFVTIPF
jgi:hypothetical protein